MSAAAGALPSKAGGKTEALLLSCMDFRLMNEIESFMSQGLHLRDNYDHIVLAGGALGAISDKYPAWQQTFWDHLELALQLHGIHTVVLMNHRDCGAYRLMMGQDLAQDPVRETDVHTDSLRRLKGLVRDRHPQLNVRLYLMGLDGTAIAL